MGLVGADGATIQRRRTGLVVDATAGPAGDAILNGHIFKGDCVGASATGTNVKHPVNPATVNDGIPNTIALDSQITAVQDIQISAGIGVFASCPSQDNGRQTRDKGDGVGSRVCIGVGDGLAQGPRPTVIGVLYFDGSSTDRLRDHQ